MTVVAYDVGRTQCRAAAHDEVGGEIGRADRVTRATAIDDPSLLATTLAELARDLAATEVRAVGAGMAGLAQAPDGARLLDILSELHPGAAIALTSDMVTAHAGALDGAAGVVVAAGTGAVAFGADGSGATARVDGWGYLLGDDGSGYAIGRAGLAAALRALDGRGGSDVLRAAAESRFGPVGALPAIVHRHENPARTVATFAADVLAAAADGDATAATIVDGAARSLAESAVAAAQALPTGAARVSWSGGLFADPRLRTGFERHVAERLPDATVVPPAGDALAGARVLTGAATRSLYGDRVLRTTVPTPSPST